jgi:hypothetical protein
MAMKVHSKLCLRRKNGSDVDSPVEDPVNEVPVSDMAHLRRFIDRSPDELNVGNSLDPLSREIRLPATSNVSHSESPDDHPCATSELIDLSGLPDAVPLVAFEDGGRLVRPSVSGKLCADITPSAVHLKLRDVISKLDDSDLLVL